MMKLKVLAGAAMIGVAALAASGNSGAAEARGAMLYSTYCGECHTTEVHWRDKRLATDWASLLYQVRRWEQNIGLDLNGDDTEAIANYLNGLYYRFQVPGAKKSG